MRSTAPDMAAAERALARVFGHPSFRPGQAEIVEAVLGGEDVLAVMPTGAGKSLLYQLPAVMGRGPVVVVSPLISLMRDQVEALRHKGVAAGALHSASDIDDAARVLALMNSRRIALLYLAPERLTQPGTVDALNRLRPKILAIDEAHCVSRWADDFRPDYGRVPAVAADIGAPQIVAVTATAGPRTRADIVTRLFSRVPLEFVRSFARPNIAISFRSRRDMTADVRATIARRTGESGIVYCASRATTDRLARDLSRSGVTALPYHAGLDAGTRDSNQDRFLRERGTVMVATIAFGMGIDKPDVRFVLHADLPQSIEAYYQEIGRAGRDAAPADAIALVDPRLGRAGRALSPDAAAMFALARHPGCRWQALLHSFGEASKPCGVCDLCAHDALRMRRVALHGRRAWSSVQTRIVAAAERTGNWSWQEAASLPEPPVREFPPALPPRLLTIAQTRLRAELAGERDRISRRRRVAPALVASPAILDALAFCESESRAAELLSANGRLAPPARDLLVFFLTKRDAVPSGEPDIPIPHGGRTRSGAAS